jgi:hypothetical protein
MSTISQEEIYKNLKEENWEMLIDIFYKRKDIIKQDSLLSKSLETVINVITSKSLQLETKDDFVNNVEQFLLLHSSKFIELKSDQIEAIKIAVANAKRHDISYAYNYAKEYPNNEICKEIIIEYEKTFPTKSNISNVDLITVIENNLIDLDNDFRKSLFNSNQELEFYLALKRVFDTYQIYPNVAISSVINFDLIKDKLTSSQRDFFFKSSIDFVVFEPLKNYFPVYFFEIDSIWHDSEIQIKKDDIKDKILSISGQKLYRIRKMNNSINEMEFEKLIREIRALTS